MIGCSYSWIVATTIEVCLLIGVVWMIQSALGRWLSPRASYALWCLVLVRLLLLDVPSLPGGGLADSADDSLLARSVSSRAAGDSTRASTDPSRPRTSDSPPTIARSGTFDRMNRERPGRQRSAVSLGRARARVAPDVGRRDRRRAAGEPTAPAVTRGVAAPPRRIDARFDPGESSVTAWPPAAATFHWETFLVVAWWAGALFVIGLAVVRERIFRRRLSAVPPSSCPRLVRLVADGRQTLGLRRSVDVGVSDLVRSPAVCGIRHPALLFPTEATTLSDADLRHIILHELAHVKRHDVALNWVLLLAEALHWFNPFARWALLRLRQARETARDFDALSASPDSDPIGYAQTFLRLIASQPRRRDPSPVVGFLRTRGEARRRILMIRSFDRVSRRRCGLVGLALLIVLGWASLTEADRPLVAENGATGSQRTIPVERRDPPPKWRAELEAALEQTIDIDIEGSVRDLVSFLAERTGANFVMLRHVADENILPVRGKAISLRRVLRQAFLYGDLEYSLYNGAFLIGENGEVPQHLDLRFYNVKSLLDARDPDACEWLVLLIHEVVGREVDWEREGVRITAWRDLVCVTQTSAMHDELHRLLNMLANRGSVAEAEPDWRGAIEEKLRRKVDVEFEDRELREVLAFLSERAGLDFSGAEWFDVEQTITLKLSDVTVGDVLFWLETLVGARSHWSEGAIDLSDRPQLSTRVYEVRDLLPSSAEDPSDSDGDEDEVDVEALADLIEESVQSTSWTSWEEGGCALHFFGGMLVMVQTEAAHRELELLFASLRRALR